MGFFVPHMDMGKDSEPQAGQDYTPRAEADGYKPIINIHSNHANLDNGLYDPRRDLSKSLSLEQVDDEPATSRMGRNRRLALGLLLALLAIIGLALFLIPM